MMLYDIVKLHLLNLLHCIIKGSPDRFYPRSSSANQCFIGPFIKSIYKKSRTDAMSDIWQKGHLGGGGHHKHILLQIDIIVQEKIHMSKLNNINF